MDKQTPHAVGSTTSVTSSVAAAVQSAESVELHASEQQPLVHTSTGTNQARARGSRTLISSGNHSNTSSPTSALRSAHGEGPQTPKRRTVANRLGSAVSATSIIQNQQVVVPQLEHLTQMLKQCVMQPNNKGDCRGVEKEILFVPPWESKIGQLQHVVRALYRNADVIFENRGAVIVRCYPLKSSTYMHLVYNLIYATLASNARYGAMQSPKEIRPILLNYDNDKIAANPVIYHVGQAYDGIPHFSHQTQWTDAVLIRISFANHEPANCFLESFNRNVGRVFDRHQVRTPFAHPDLSAPERKLRHCLQQKCIEKNSGMQNGRINRPYMCYEGRYMHNGVQLYKISPTEQPNGRLDPVPWVPYTEAQLLHVIVASLRKYAAVYKQKESSVIIQNIDEDEAGKEADKERITAVVYEVVSSEEYRQRCLNVKQAFLQKKAKFEGQPVPPLLDLSPQSPNIYLPQYVERLPRRKPKAFSESKSSQKGDAKDTKDGGHANKDAKEVNAGEGGEKPKPLLVRVQFRAKEAATAFCQVFKEFQTAARQKQEKKAAEGEGEEDTKSQTDSYSDLSDLETTFGDAKDGTPTGKNAKKVQPTFFPNAFAHRDLTPPELALGYALRQFCREHNAAKNAEATGTSDEGKTKPPGRFLYTRAGRIFERIHLQAD